MSGWPWSAGTGGADGDEGRMSWFKVQDAVRPSREDRGQQRCDLVCVFQRDGMFQPFKFYVLRFHHAPLPLVTDYSNAFPLARQRNLACPQKSCGQAGDQVGIPMISL